jgi:diaminopimelate decarboxylase
MPSHGPFERNAQGELCCDGASLAAIAAEFNTPVFVYSERAIADAYRGFAQAARQEHALVCYALKANSSLAIIRLLSGLGAGFDIVSGGELQRVLAAGGSPGKVGFSGVGKSADEIRMALAAGIKCINVESEMELDTVAAIASAMGCVAPISLRVNPDIDAKTHPYISTGLKDNKFGIPMHEALRIYQKAAGLPGIAIKGIDCHIGSQITTLAPFLDSLDRVLALAGQLHDQGITLDHLDLGGGLGIRYNDESPPAPGELLAALFARIRQWSSDKKMPVPEILFEFGRAIVGNAGVLLTKVELLKPGADKNFAVIDAAMNDLMRPALYEAWHGVARVHAASSASEKTWDIVGPVCESGDWMARGRKLALAPGDLLAVLSAGAYGMSMSSNYNSRPRAAEVLVDAHGAAHLIRRRETFTDLIGPESVPDRLKA